MIPFEHYDVVDMLALPARRGWSGAESLYYLFRGLEERIESLATPADFVARMDENGIGATVLSIQSDADREWVLGLAEAHAGRILPALGVDPRNGMSEIRRVREYLESGVRLLRLGPWNIGKPPTDRIYWPIYAMAAESSVPVQINIGIPGPRAPGWTQDPIFVDEVCYEFPELTVVMTHIGSPWVDTAIHNLRKWPNCHLAVNAYAPRRWPRELVEFIRGGGWRKVLYATEYPVIDWRRSLSEIEAYDFDDVALRALLAGNARAILPSVDVP